MAWHQIVALMSMVCLSAVRAEEADSTQNRSFVIDFDNNRFLKDGEPFRYFSGSIHYFRVVPEYWFDRMLRMKALGMNAIEFYVNWGVHEEMPGQFDFRGMKNITRFMEVAQQLDLTVIIRLGPFTCGEWDNGGYPWWLFKIKGIKTRSSDRLYLEAVFLWYQRLFPLLIPMLYKNGGPIIMMQVENEYGYSENCDHKYMQDLRDLIKSYVGNDVVLFTVDNPSANVSCGVVEGVYPTVDFWPGDRNWVAKQFATQRQFAPKGPLVNTEFYPSWFSEWGGGWPTCDKDTFILGMSYMYDMGASFNFYMGHGGTNFGHMAGGKEGGPQHFTSVTTSYDYDAPISEDGRQGSLFMDVRAAIEALSGKVVKTPVPKDPILQSYGFVEAQSLGTVTSLLKSISPANRTVRSAQPLTFEDINFPFGFILYQAIAAVTGSSVSIEKIADRGYLMIDEEFQGIFIRGNISTIQIKISKGQKISILVENQGRLVAGMGDPKGILSPVLIDSKAAVTDWTMYPIVPEALFSEGSLNGVGKNSAEVYSESKTPKTKYEITKSTAFSTFASTVYAGRFDIEIVGDTYLNTTGWGKGQAYINGHNIGRYWPKAGPQFTLYIPKTMLTRQNHFVLLELERPNCVKNEMDEKCLVSFTSERITHNLNGLPVKPAYGHSDTFR